MIGAHFQSAPQDWPNAVKLLPAGVWCKSVNDQHLCRDMKRVNPGVKVVFRYENNHDQTPQTDHNTNKTIARNFFKKFIDGTFWEQQLYKYMDAIEEWNEYLGNSQSPQEKAMWLDWCKAVNEVWTEEYRYNKNLPGDLSHIRLVSCNTAIGNDIPVEFARVVQDHDGILSYHNYTSVLGKVIRTDDWQYYSGRWTVMDKAYRYSGVTIKWLFTEGGPTAIGTYNGQYYGGVYEGWKHKASYNGDFQAYLDGTIAYQLNNCTAWNATHGNRCLGGVLFTSGGGGAWDNYQLDADQLRQIFVKVKEYGGPVEPPPTERKWNKLVVLLPQNTTLAQYLQVCHAEGFPTRTEIAFSADSAFAKAQNSVEHKVIVYNVDQWGGRAALEAWLAQYYNHGTVVQYKSFQV